MWRQGDTGAEPPQPRQAAHTHLFQPLRAPPSTWTTPGPPTFPSPSPVLPPPPLEFFAVKHNRGPSPACLSGLSSVGAPARAWCRWADAQTSTASPVPPTWWSEPASLGFTVPAKRCHPAPCVCRTPSPQLDPPRASLRGRPGTQQHRSTCSVHGAQPRGGDRGLGCLPVTPARPAPSGTPPPLPSFHSLVAGLMMPKSSSQVTALGSRSTATGFLFRF